jgi:hypothetical protein
MISPAEQRIALPCKAPLLQIPVAAIQGARSLNYRAEIGRASPTAIMMVVDQSASINHRLKSGQSKAAYPANVLKRMCSISADHELATALLLRIDVPASRLLRRFGVPEHPEQGHVIDDLQAAADHQRQR